MPKVYNQMSTIYDSQVQECVKTGENYTLFILTTPRNPVPSIFSHGALNIDFSDIWAPSIAVICSKNHICWPKGKILHGIFF